MNSKIFSLLFLLALFMTACNDDKIIFFENHVKEEDNGGSETTVPRLFEVINLDYPGLEKVKAKIQEKVRDNFYSPVSIEKVDNVWCSSYVIFRSLLLLNIVETV